MVPLPDFIEPLFDLLDFIDLLRVDPDVLPVVPLLSVMVLPEPDVPFVEPDRVPDCAVPYPAVVPDPVLPDRVVMRPLCVVGVPAWLVVPVWVVPVPVCAMAEPAAHRATAIATIAFFIGEKMFFVRKNSVIIPLTPCCR